MPTANMAKQVCPAFMDLAEAEAEVLTHNTRGQEGMALALVAIKTLMETQQRVTEVGVGVAGGLLQLASPAALASPASAS